MKDLDLTQIDETTGDIKRLEGRECDILLARNTLCLQRGEWFLNKLLGVDWLSLQSKQNDKTFFKDDIARELHQAGFSNLSKIHLKNDPSQRTMSVEIYFYNTKIIVERNL